MKLLTLFVSLSISFICFAQDSSINKHHPIYFKAFSGWKQDGHRLNGKALKKELYKVPEAIPYYKKAIIFNRIGLLSSVSTLPLIILGNQKNKISYPYNSKIGFTIAGVITAGATFYLLTQYKKNIKKAVKLYNEY